jgi:hypothetical protein
MIFAYGNFQIPPTRDEITPVSAVRECSRKELVTYGVSVPTVPEAHVSMNSISHTLAKVS